MIQPPGDDQPLVAAAVIVRGGRVLLVRRQRAEGSLSWQFPAGGVETGETPEDAAVRETLEETKLTVVAVRILGERVHPSTKRRMVYVECEFLAGDAAVGDPVEVAEVRWCCAVEIVRLVPNGFFGPVKEYLDAVVLA